MNGGSKSSSPQAGDIDTPIGRMHLECTEAGLSRAAFVDRVKNNSPLKVIGRESVLLFQAATELCQYFAGQRAGFTVPLDPSGTEFQRQVWKALLEIEWGQTRTYGQIAQSITKPKASRAVGLANGQNPLAIIVPCHRVIGSNGSLTGYAGGLERKQWLLEHEAGQGTLFQD